MKTTNKTDDEHFGTSEEIPKETSDDFAAHKIIQQDLTSEDTAPEQYFSQHLQGITKNLKLLNYLATTLFQNPRDFDEMTLTEHAVREVEQLRMIAFVSHNIKKHIAETLRTAENLTEESFNIWAVKLLDAIQKEERLNIYPDDDRFQYVELSDPTLLKKLQTITKHCEDHAFNGGEFSGFLKLLPEKENQRSRGWEYPKELQKLENSFRKYPQKSAGSTQKRFLIQFDDTAESRFDVIIETNRFNIEQIDWIRVRDARRVPPMARNLSDHHSFEFAAQLLQRRREANKTEPDHES